MNKDLLIPVRQGAHIERNRMEKNEIRANVHLKKGTLKTVVVYLSVGIDLLKPNSKYELFKFTADAFRQSLVFKLSDKGYSFAANGKSKKGRAISTEIDYDFLPSSFQEALLKEENHHVTLSTTLDDDGDFVLTLN